MQDSSLRAPGGRDGRGLSGPTTFLEEEVCSFVRVAPLPDTLHIYGNRTTTALHGIVEVAADPAHPWGVGTCRAVVMEDCIEP